MIPSAPQTVELFKSHTEAKLRGLLCPVHRQAPRLVVRGESLREASISVSACCTQLIEMANKALAAG